jgi:hypothetical protein
VRLLISLRRFPERGLVPCLPRWRSSFDPRPFTATRRGESRDAAADSGANVRPYLAHRRGSHFYADLMRPEIFGEAIANAKRDRNPAENRSAWLAE